MSSLRIGALFSLTLTLSLTSQSVVCGDPAKPCNPDICKLPDCFCSGTEIPGNLPASSIPQIVFISFDGAFNNDLYEPDDLKNFFNDDGLKTLKNPNGCNISVTSAFYLISTPIIARFKICIVSVTKSPSIRYLADSQNHVGRMLP